MYAAIDFETQGFDPSKDAPTEIGVIIFDDNFHEIWTFNYIIQSPLTRPQPKEIEELTGIDDDMISFGMPESKVVQEIANELWGAKAIFAYNAPFDMAFLHAMFARHDTTAVDALVVDVQRDVEYPARFTCKKLTHLAYDHGIYPEEGAAHRAIVDVRLMLKLLSKYDLQTVLKNAAEPKVTLRIRTSGDFKAGNEYSKSLGFKFISETKFWCKTVRESEVEQIIKGSKYPVERI